MVSAHTDSNSLSARMRRKRMRYLDAAIASFPEGSLSIADLGGTASFWQMNLQHLSNAGRIAKIDVYNLEPVTEEVAEVEHVRIMQFEADVTSLAQVADKTYDIVFSNSVVEHVGNLLAQRKFANEVMRVGQRYVVQTPNRSFPIEPHFYVPFFPFIPLGMRAWMHQKCKLGWLDAEPDPLQARIDCDQTRLLTRRELRLLFPGAQLHREWLCGMVKSFILAGGSAS